MYDVETSYSSLFGPRFIFKSSDKFKNEVLIEIDWYFNGEKIECSSREEFNRIIKMKAFI